MATIAYLTNSFPAQVEGDVMQEISELRRRGVTVVPCSARPAPANSDLKIWAAQTMCLAPFRLHLVIQTIWLCISNSSTMSAIAREALFGEPATLVRRLKALLHTFLGAYFAVLLEGKAVDHIHVHHGYFSCWVAMAAARLRGIGYSVTLHGSDLLLHKAFLQTKLAHCEFCITVSDFGRQHIVDHYPAITREKIFVRKMGVEPALSRQSQPSKAIVILSVGRLHEVKNHGFLIEACARLNKSGCDFACLIAGEGKERKRLERLIRKSGLEHKVLLMGHLSPAHLDAYYSNANLVVLTSRSEGLPIVLMEAMSRTKVVLAPAITGIPELIIDGVTGFLYEEGSLDSFVGKIENIHKSPLPTLEAIATSARLLILEKYNRETNLADFADLLLRHISRLDEPKSHENLVLQQI